MANIKSAKKRIKTNKKKRILNNDVKSSMRTAIKKLEKLVTENKKEEANNFLSTVIKKIDKASVIGVIKKNTSNRYKSRVTKMVNKK